MDLRPICLSFVLPLLSPSVALAQAGPDAAGNVTGPITNDFLALDGSDGVTGTPLSPGADGSSDVTLPFSFAWYGGNTTVASVSANGALRFGGGLTVSESNQSLPTSSGDGPDVAVFWDDLDPSAGGAVRWYEDTVAGRFIISWEDVPHGTGVGAVSFQVQLFVDGTLQFHWADTQFGDALYDGGLSATVGIQDVLGGTQSAGNALEHSFNAGGVLDGTAIYVGPCAADVDGDGFVSALCGSGGTDCDDFDASRYPGAPEVCDDSLDQDCDGVDLVGDVDMDGFTSLICGGTDCDDSDGLVNPIMAEVCADAVDNDCDLLTLDLFDSDADGVDCSVDCDDEDAGIAPGLAEVCDDSIDQDCDGVDLQGDLDADSFSTPVCGGGDCDDGDALTYPGAPEFVCDGVDQACDGLGNEEDADADGYALCDDDCDDADPTSWPGAPELCADSVDNDCDGVTDELADDDYLLVDDGSMTFQLCTFSFPFCGESFDSFTLHSNGRVTFGDAGGGGFVDGSGADVTSAGSVSDLHGDAPQLAFLWSDLDPTILGSVHVEEDSTTSNLVITFDGVTQNPSWPGAVLGGNTVEVSFGATGVATYDYGSTAGELAIVGWSCGSANSVSLDLSEPELPDGVARIGQGNETAVFEVFGAPGGAGAALDLENQVISFCLTSGVDADSDGWSDQCGDCDDADSTVFPGAAELCDGVDHDCNGVVDDADKDDDGYIASACGGVDCDDTDLLTNPSGIETCDGLDNDCDGLPESGGEDQDGDGWLVCGGDCDDARFDVNPGAIEICNEVDDNCDSFIDEGWDRDQDSDGTVNESCGGDDCDDLDPEVSPLADEVCDGKDNNCDGVSDNADLDEDGFFDEACGGDDCNDTRPQIFPDADEICDGNDNDCNGFENDVDLDGDGEIDANCGGTDCNDGDPAVNTLGSEVCDDGEDNDCNGGTDQGGEEQIGDPECTGCSVASSVGKAPASTGWLAVVLCALCALRRRRPLPTLRG